MHFEPTTQERLREPTASKVLLPPNVKHQRARAEVSRVKDELSLRALRCMR